MIKIFGGVAKGFSLKTPSDNLTRPTSVLLRRKLFDSIQDLSGMVFIDLCAGIGSVGLEASSRGADKVYFVEKSRAAMNILKKNVQLFDQKFNHLSHFSIIQKDFRKCLREIIEQQTENHSVIVFFDPPYEEIDLYFDFFKLFNTLRFQGRLVIEACQNKTMKMEDFQANFGDSTKSFRQGTSYFLIYDF